MMDGPNSRFFATPLKKVDHQSTRFQLSASMKNFGKLLIITSTGHASSNDRTFEDRIAIMIPIWTANRSDNERISQ